LGNSEGAERILISPLGADEFAIVLGGLADRVEASRFAKAVLMAISRPYEGIAPQVYLTGRIGMTLAPDDGMHADDLLRKAASIVHHEDRSGRNSYKFYAEGMAATATRRFELEAMLGQAVEDGELEVYYQPQACLESGRIVGAEALVRWRHDDAILPAELFIATAEDVGLIAEIGNRVLLSACREAKRLHDRGLGPFSVSINISAYQFRRLDMVDVISKVLSESGLDPQSLVLEVTESLVLSDVERTVEAFAALRAMGIHLALDDFGTGYSSLSYLKSLTIDRLKLDRSFVSGLPGDPGDRAVTEAIIRMAQALQIEVTAEGVENKQQLEYLRGLGCDHYQGFLLAKPLPLDRFERFLGDYEAPAQARS
ncbi:MAG: GGDEF domain-containing protein, partial [Alphaproteobacteria bacterium]